MDIPPAVRVVTDSISDVPQPLADELGIIVVPTTFSFGQATYREGVDMTREEFYTRLTSARVLPTTAAPGAGVFADAYRTMVQQNQEAGVPLEGIVSLHPPTHLSGLYNAAYAGSGMVEGVRVEVIDTGQISMAMGWQAVAAARAASKGCSLQEIVAALRAMRRRSYLLAAVETLDWAARSGRVNRLVAAMGNLLAVKPLLRMYDGELTLAERVRTRTRQLERMIEMVVALAPFAHVAVVHARAAEVAQRMVERMSQVHAREGIVVSEISSTLGTYAGPGACGIAVVQA